MQILILNNTVEVEIDLVKLQRPKFVRYDGRFRPQYSFISPFTGTTWIIQPDGYSRHFQSQFWNAYELYEGGLSNGTFGLSRKQAIMKALQTEKGVYQ